MLSGEAILEQIESGKIVIEPFNKKQVNPNSYNLTLGDTLLVYTEDTLDYGKDNPTRIIKIGEEGYLLSPGILYLANTKEYTETYDLVPQISGRSSIGRVGLTVHLASGLGNLGYRGTWTLGITCIRPTMIFPGMEIGQIYYFPIEGEYENNYNGVYQGSREPKSSKGYLEYEN